VVNEIFRDALIFFILLKFRMGSSKQSANHTVTIIILFIRIRGSDQIFF